MNQLMGAWIGLIALCLASGCAVAPLTNQQTGRTLGPKNIEVSAGVAALGGDGGLVSIKGTFGVLDDLDVGIHYETLTFGAFLKYSLINNKSGGFSLAPIISYGSSIDGNYVYAGLAASYLTGTFEPYGSIRYNSVSYNANSLDLGDLGNLNYPSGDYSYLYYTLGVVVWPTHWLGIAPEVSFFGPTSGGDISGDPLLSAALMFRF